MNAIQELQDTAMRLCTHVKVRRQQLDHNHGGTDFLDNLIDNLSGMVYDLEAEIWEMEQNMGDTCYK